MKQFLAVTAAIIVLAVPHIARACPMSIVPTLLAASEVADAATTVAGLSQGAREANPAVRPFTRSAPILLGVMFTLDFTRHRSGVLGGVSCGQQTTGDIIMTVLHGIVAAHNASLLKH